MCYGIEYRLCVSIVFTLIIFGIFDVYGENKVTVTLQHGGKLQGFMKTVGGASVDTFLGIPYAAPPVDHLRFAKPEPHPGWSGTKDASVHGNACWQLFKPESLNEDLVTKLLRIRTPMSEDCLFLNVWSPSGRKEMSSLPVMVWIHGGGYLTGANSLELYNGTYLSGMENLVVVSIQYRLGTFGFFSLPSNNKSENKAMGNQGLYDQIMALEWVKHNIAQFGGNPNNVTIFGEGAGSACVSLLWLSPKTENLFKRVIMQSGSALSPWAVSSMERGNMKSQMVN